MRSGENMPEKNNWSIEVRVDGIKVIVKDLLSKDETLALSHSLLDAVKSLERFSISEPIRSKDERRLSRIIENIVPARVAKTKSDYKFTKYGS